MTHYVSGSRTVIIVQTGYIRIPLRCDPECTGTFNVAAAVLQPHGCPTCSTFFKRYSNSNASDAWACPGGAGSVTARGAGRGRSFIHQESNYIRIPVLACMHAAACMVRREQVVRGVASVPYVWAALRRSTQLHPNLTAGLVAYWYYE